MIDSSSSSPPTRIDCETTIPPSEITATSLVPPPMSTTIEPVGSPTGRPAPIAAAIGSSIRYAWGATALGAAPSEHRLGHLKVGDHPVLERTDRRDRAGRAAQHPLGLNPHGMDLAGPGIDRHH